MAIEQVKDYFRQYQMEGKILEFEVSSATVELAAAALQCEPARIAKTLSFLVEGKAVLIVAAGDTKIDNPKYKSRFGTGSSNSAIELTIPELETYSDYLEWVDVCKR